MPEAGLTARPALGGYEREWTSVSLREIDGLSIVALAMPRTDNNLTQTLEKATGCAWPKVGHIQTNGAYQVIGLQSEQIFVVYPRQGDNPVPEVTELVGGEGYVTDQSDAWVVLEIDGAGSRAALERICPVDLHEVAFPIGQTARTAMEHMGSVVIRTGENRFQLMSARSSAASFLHALEMSINYTQ